MKFKDIKEEIKTLAKEIKNAKCESKCANRLAHFNSYDRHGINCGRHQWPWVGGGCSGHQVSCPRPVVKLWDKFENSKSKIESLKWNFIYKHTAYCLMRGRKIEEIFTKNGNTYFFSENFLKHVNYQIQKWNEKLEVDHE